MAKLASDVDDVAALMEKQRRERVGAGRTDVREPGLLVLAFAQPLLLLLTFRYFFGGAIHTPDGSYGNFRMPAILVLTAVFGSLATGMGLSDDLSKGIVDRLRSLPMARSAVLLGRTLSDLGPRPARQTAASRPLGPTGLAALRPADPHGRCVFNRRDGVHFRPALIGGPSAVFCRQAQFRPISLRLLR
jgi:ABC-2 type transporter